MCTLENLDTANQCQVCLAPRPYDEEKDDDDADGDVLENDVDDEAGPGALSSGNDAKSLVEAQKEQKIMGNEPEQLQPANLKLRFLKDFVATTCNRPEYASNFINGGVDDICLLEFIEDADMLQSEFNIANKFHRQMIFKKITQFQQEMAEFKTFFEQNRHDKFNLRRLYAMAFESKGVVTWPLLSKVIGNKKRNLKRLLSEADDGLVQYIFDECKARMNYQKGAMHDAASKEQHAEGMETAYI